MIVFIYQTVVSLQLGTISFEEATNQINALVLDFDKYVVKGSRDIFYFTMNGEFIYFVLVKRYNLLQSDCSIAFNLKNGPYFDKYNNIIMGVSEVPVDEDMSEAIYNPNIGLFFNIEDPDRQ